MNTVRIIHKGRETKLSRKALRAERDARVRAALDARKGTK